MFATPNGTTVARLVQNVSLRRATVVPLGLANMNSVASSLVTQSWAQCGAASGATNCGLPSVTTTTPASTLLVVTATTCS